MAEQPELNNSYEMRRVSRGKAAAVTVKNWKRRLWIIGFGIFVLGVMTVCGAMWYHMTYVPTLTARIRAAVVELSVKVDAPLLELYVREEQPVHKGEVLARLDDTELRASLTAVEAEMAIRQSAFAQAQSKEKLIGASIEADIAVAAARVAMAESRVIALESELESKRKRLPEEVRQARAALARQEAELALLKAGPRAEEVASARERIASAKATLNLCELEVKQSQELVAEGIDPQHILEVRKTELETQKHTLRQAELDLVVLEAGARSEKVRMLEQAIEGEKASVALTELGEAVVAAEHLLEVRRAEWVEAKGVLEQTKARAAEVEIAKQETLAAEAELRKAKATVAGRQAALETMEIVSPVDGVVARVFVEVGELCRKGIPVILVNDVSVPRWIEAYVDEEDAMEIHPGQKASLYVPANSRNRIKATVTQMGLHTQTLDQGAETQTLGQTSFGQPDRVWVKLEPADSLPAETVTGTTARGVIRVR